MREESERELQLISDLPSQKNTQPLKHTNTQPLTKTHNLSNTKTHNLSQKNTTSRTYLAKNISSYWSTLTSEDIYKIIFQTCLKRHNFEISKMYFLVITQISKVKNSISLCPVGHSTPFQKCLFGEKYISNIFNDY